MACYIGKCYAKLFQEVMGSLLVGNMERLAIRLLFELPKSLKSFGFRICTNSAFIPLSGFSWCLMNLHLASSQ